LNSLKEIQSQIWLLSFEIKKKNIIYFKIVKLNVVYCQAINFSLQSRKQIFTYNFEVDNVFFFNFKTQKKKEKKINAKSQDGVSTFYTLI
jgi:hypothetical protein